ncbi:MAG: methionyl-tRNA formyltransferase [Ignavibacteriales bacterium]|nr:methionyl-tRNA formyltransferase [Ignavibacteriales bacterium]
MKIVFMGTPEFALPSLNILAANGYAIAAVVTAPDRERGRGLHVTFTPVKQAALDAGYSILQPSSLKDPVFTSALRDLEADLFVIVAFRILPREIYSLPAKGSFNLHASLLPRYRGAAPINWALINGDRETGVTTFFLQERVDTGSIILQSRCAVDEDATAGELHDRLAILGADTVLRTVQMIESGTVHPVPQPNDAATAAPKIFREDCRIGWNRSTEQIHNFVRGLSPHPAAWTIHRERVIKIYRTRRLPGVCADARQEGHITVDNGRLIVATADGTLEILELQQEGKRRMTAEEFLRGYVFNRGEWFEEP